MWYFDLGHVKVVWGSLGALLSKFGHNSSQNKTDEKLAPWGGGGGYYAECICGTFDLVQVQCIFVKIGL